MFGILISALLAIAALAVWAFLRNTEISRAGSALSGGMLFLSIVIALLNMYTTVPAGHVKVASLFGEIQPEPYEEGLHFPINPLLGFKTVDGRQKTHSETAGIPSEDKLITNFDVSVQYRIIKGYAPEMIRNTGDAETAISVHLVPKVRSILREQGKGVEQAQDFFKESVQVRLQDTLQMGLGDYLTQHGIQVDSVLIRSVTLPNVIQNSITETKRREQEVIKQEAELERYAMEQDQKIRKAESELEAALLQAERKRTLADAEAYQIKVVNEQLNQSPRYIELKKVEQWNGVLPIYSGGENVPLLDLRATG